MKKPLAVILAVAMVFSSISFADSGILNKISSSQSIQNLKTMGATLIQNTLAKFKDVKAGEWYMDSVSKLVELGGIKGYEDGTFRPTGTITRAEYTSIVAGSLGLKPVEGVTGHWSAGIMAAATQAGLVQAGEFADVTKPITRNEMARMVVRAVMYQKEAVPTDYLDYAALVADLASTGTFKDDVTKVVAMGIISGYPDKTFQGARTLSRAEASAVVIRILDKDARKVPNKPSVAGTIQLGETKPVTEFVNNVTELNKFNPNLKTVTLVTAESLGLKVEKTPGTDTMTIRAPGRTGVMTAIKDGKTVTAFSGAYMPGLNGTLYDTSRFPVDYKTIDYFGFFRMDDQPGMKLVINPWKE